ncbi:DUF2510 domain-containing protein [Streptomyces sp. P9(2023)]|uniref:DUF2510 domain-containing protein n=1 Tax=Streptomyces sp. P9(2023) TaxID=3064394 RepID=UPI0028F3FA4E|nr:DUF2510 domain-containing protein [Streptomyces sp. P9(2023)]MDT9692853.1 DUF2510 domain-containing protein [Streptomyces sp. P9(2023)]
MSMTTPPGWYPDPATPTVERWWDGTNWTAHTRQAPTAATAVSPVPPVRNGRNRAVVLGAVAVAVVVAVVAGVLVVGGDDQEDPPTAGPTGTASTTAAPTSSATTDAPADDGEEEEDPNPTQLVDQLNGITVPVVKGWEKPEYYSTSMAPSITTVGEYPCPGATNKKCRHGTVSSHAASGTDAATPEALAKEDIAVAAKETYEEDVFGSHPYGRERSHTVVAARPAVVAGRTGHLVRWKVVTDKGPGSYLQSLVFPSPTGSGSPVIVRFLFDAGPDGPSLAVMDEITRGIKPIGSDTNGGVGSSITPGTTGH